MAIYQGTTVGESGGIIQSRRLGHLPHGEDCSGYLDIPMIIIGKCSVKHGLGLRNCYGTSTHFVTEPILVCAPSRTTDLILYRPGGTAISTFEVTP